MAVCATEVGWKAGSWRCPVCPGPTAWGWKNQATVCLISTDLSPLMTATPISRVYGVSLRTHLQELGRDIALPIEACVLMLLSEGMQEEVRAEAWGLAGPRASPTLLSIVPLSGGGVTSHCQTDSDSLIGISGAWLHLLIPVALGVSGASHWLCLARGRQRQKGNVLRVT